MASIDEAKDIIKGTPISSVINFYHPISKRGGNYEGICPFHGDSHPSLKINDSKGIYKCFACDAAGDSIKFVQDKLSLNYIEAIKDIASNLGITIEEKEWKNKDPRYEIALKVLKAANRLYKKIASEMNPANYKAFLTKRGLNEESVTNFEIGYAPPNNALTKYLNTIPESERTMAIKVAKEIGLIRDNKHGAGYYDFYRDRVVFPIWDHSTKVRGFSSRAVLPDQKPKYLNSGESFIFDKGNTLYGFHLAKRSIRETDSAIVVEGNMDAITLHQYGFKNSVATMGVSLSQSSIKLLTNMAKDIYLAMDSDPAGIKAMTRINNDFLAIGIVPKFISFEPAKDPDEFLNEYGRLELMDRIEKADTFLDFLINQAIPESIPQSTDKKLEILKEVFKILMPLGTNIRANEKVIETAKALSLASSNEDIINEYKEFMNSNKPLVKSQSFKKQPVKAPEPEYIPPTDEMPQFLEEESNALSNVSIKINKPEKVFLEILLTHPELILKEEMTEILDLIEHFEVKRIVQWLKNIYLEIDEAEYLLFANQKMKETMPDEIKMIFAKSLQSYKNLKLDSDIIGKMLGDLKVNLEVEKLKFKREALRNKQRNAISDEEGLTFLKEIQSIEQELLALRNK